MFRSATILIILAFLLGLWIGLNPDSRARAQQALDRVGAALTDLGAQAKAALDHAFNRVSQESPPPSRPPVKPEPSNFLGQLSQALTKIWDALKQLWNDLVHSSRSATWAPPLSVPLA
ncbi:MAG: hypothetical protein ACM3QS_15205 [Bacteroidota bacterium]